MQAIEHLQTVLELTAEEVNAIRAGAKEIELVTIVELAKEHPQFRHAMKAKLLTQYPPEPPAAAPAVAAPQQTPPALSVAATPPQPAAAMPAPPTLTTSVPEARVVKPKPIQVKVPRDHIPTDGYGPLPFPLSITEAKDGTPWINIGTSQGRKVGFPPQTWKAALQHAPLMVQWIEYLEGQFAEEQAKR